MKSLGLDSRNYFFYNYKKTTNKIHVSLQELRTHFESMFNDVFDEIEDVKNFIHSYIFDNSVPTFPGLIEFISLEEMKTAIKHLKRSKVTGEDQL